jgi:hypothetical protein
MINKTNAPCPCRQVVGEVVSLLVALQRVVPKSAFTTVDDLVDCQSDDDCDFTSAATVVGKAIGYAIERRWIDLDEALTMTSSLLECNEAAALSLLV